MAVQYAFGKIITQGLDLNVDAADPTSYTSGSSSWISVVNRSVTGSIISCSYSSDFKGGIVFNNPSASVVFPGTVANYGTGSFTVEMAFRPDQINGIHYLVSDNSGSFPNWGVYLSGSAGSGKLFSFYNISSTVSCSVSSSSTFVTGSNYFVDTVFSPLERRTYINVEGNYDAISLLGNGTGSLSTTASLFLGNLAPSSSQAYSGSIFSTKVYSTFTSGFTNFKSVAPRVNKPIPARPASALALVVAGGGGGASGGAAGGGGAGGVRFIIINTAPGIYNILVGSGGVGNNQGQSSSFGDIISAGGGKGNSGAGGSGGGGGASNTSGSGNTPAVIPPQGFDGGKGSDAFGGGGGGGGAGQKGLDDNGVRRGGNGGAGLAFSISGVTTYYGGGGGAAGYYQSAVPGGDGGIGGGGSGSKSNTPGQPGQANTGGGGGGSQSQGPGNGGSGIVIIRYPGIPIATGGTITSVGGDTIHTFTATGSSTFTVF
jgi:hypothetical protein